MQNRKVVYVFKNVHNMLSVINYDATNNAVNTFLRLFDCWESYGQSKVSDDGNHQEMWFECPNEMWDMFHSEEFKIAFKRMNVELVFENPCD